MTMYTGEITEIPMFAYGGIIADSPWAFQSWSEKGEEKAPQGHYKCMPTDEIAAMPVGHLADRDCLLFMWATFPMIKDALYVMERWGFRYVTGGAWSKRTVNGLPAFGTGHVYRSSTELFFIGANGNPEYASKSIRNYIEAATRGHSVKPDEQYEHVEALAPGVRYLELFSRKTRPGWDCWGDEAGKFDPVLADEPMELTYG